VRGTRRYGGRSKTRAPAAILSDTWRYRDRRDLVQLDSANLVELARFLNDEVESVRFRRDDYELHRRGS
jgi:hypothetical protein